MGLHLEAQGRKRSERTLGFQNRYYPTPSGLNRFCSSNVDTTLVLISIPDITFIPVQSVFCQQASKFVLKRLRTMMFFLVCDV